MKKEYQIDWGKNKWLHNIYRDPVWKEIILINTTSRRFPDMFSIPEFLSGTDLSRVGFLGFDEFDYHYFVAMTGLHIPFLCPNSLLDMCTMINSCKLFIGGLSSPLSLAFGLHIPIKIGYKCDNQYCNDYFVFHNMTKHLPNVYTGSKA
jgi:hypothetical protein